MSETQHRTSVFLGLVDKTSPGLKRIGGEVNKLAGAFARLGSRAGGGIGGGLTAGLRGIVGLAGAGVRALTNLGRIAGGLVARGIGMVGAAARLATGSIVRLAAVTASLGAATVLLAGKGVMAGAGREAQVKSLQSIEGSAARAMKSLKDLKAIAAQPGIGFDEAIQGYSSLRAVRAPSGLAKSMISEMGNAVALNSGGPEDMKNALRGVSQTFGKGKIQAEELMQILEPAPMIRQAIEKAFGTANSEDLQAMMKRDAMSVTQFWERVVAQMRKLPRAGDGAKNALENVGIAAKELVIVFGQGFMGNDFTAKISAVGAWIGSLEPLARRAGEVLRRVFDQVTDAGGRMAGQFKAAWQALKAGDSNTLSRLSQGSVLLAEGAQKGAAWLQEMGQRAVGAGRQALKFAGDFATAWQMLSGGAVDSDKLMGLDPKAVGAAGGLMQGINRVKEMWGTLTSGNFGGLGEMIGHSLAQVYKLVEPWAVQMATRMAQAGVDVFKGFIAGLRKEFPKLDKFLNDAARLWEEWRPRFQALGDAIGGMIDKHLPGVIKLLDHLLTIAGLMAGTHRWKPEDIDVKGAERDGNKTAEWKTFKRVMDDPSLTPEQKQRRLKAAGLDEGAMRQEGRRRAHPSISLPPVHNPNYEPLQGKGEGGNVQVSHVFKVDQATLAHLRTDQANNLDRHLNEWMRESMA